MPASLTQPLPRRDSTLFANLSHDLTSPRLGLQSPALATAIAATPINPLGLSGLAAGGVPACPFGAPGSSKAM